MHTIDHAGVPRAGAALRWAAVLATLILAASALAATSAPAEAQADDGWASVADATIRPGSELITEGGGQCTANFIFVDGASVYIGSAAHCTGTGAATDINGCEANSLPLGTRVSVEGADQPATLAYSSWQAMQDNGESDGDTCMFNDFALLELHSDDHDKVNPTVPHWGGPMAISDGTTTGERVFSYGNSSLRAGLDLLKPKTGLSLGQGGGGWTHTVYTVTPGIPGDSGSAFLDSDGAAMGVVSTLAIAPLAGSNGVTDLSRALAYAQDNGFAGVQLAEGTEAFTPDRLPAGGLPVNSGGGDDAGDDEDEGAPAAPDSPIRAEVEVTVLGESFSFEL